MTPLTPRRQGRRRPRPWTLRLAGLCGVGAMALVAAWGLASRHRAAADLRAATEEAALRNVATVRAVRGPAEEELVLPGNVQAYVEAPIYARTNGYIKDWYTDIGAVVKRGQLLAVIDTPEVDDQLRQAEADLRTAEANDQLARSTAKRWQELLATDSVSRQETEEKVADAAAKDALVAAARANVSRLRNLEDFKHVVAPFDGVITARRTDIGALINAGSGVGPELFRLADTSKLRIYIQVPQTFATEVKTGTTADLHFAEYPGRTFPARLVRTAQALDPTARTLLVELQVDNSRRELLPGGYTEAHLKLAQPSSTVRLPVNTLLFRRDGLRVAKIEPDQRVRLTTVSLGRDFGTEVEVVEGVKAGEAVVINPPDSLVDNEQVRVAEKGGGK